jgi:hypothetical protein
MELEVPTLVSPLKATPTKDATSISAESLKERCSGALQPRVVLKRLYSGSEESPRKKQRIEIEKTDTSALEMEEHIELDFVDNLSECSTPVSRSPCKSITERKLDSDPITMPIIPGPGGATIAREIIEILAGQPSVVAASIHSLTRQLTVDHLSSNDVVEKLENAVGDMRRSNRTYSTAASDLKHELSKLNSNLAKQTDVLERLNSTVRGLWDSVRGINSSVSVSLAGVSASLDAFGSAISPTVKDRENGESTSANSSSVSSDSEQEPVSASRTQTPRSLDSKIVVPPVDCVRSNLDCHEEWCRQQEITNKNLGARKSAFPHFDAPMQRLYPRMKVRAPFRDRNNNRENCQSGLRGNFRGKSNVVSRGARSTRY